MDDPFLLRQLGTVHREQEMALFASEGASSGVPWAPLNARYAIRKRKAVGAKKILVLTGETKAAFTKKGGPGYFERYVPLGDRGIFQFGAISAIGATHRAGNPSLSPAQSATARRVFGGRAPRLPARDPNPPKTAPQLQEMRDTLVGWFVARLKQGLRAAARLGIR